MRPSAHIIAAMEAKKQTAATAEDVAKIVKAFEDFTAGTLPALSGSEKQIAWATDLRARYLERHTDAFRALVEKAKSGTATAADMDAAVLDCATTRLASYIISVFR